MHGWNWIHRKFFTPEECRDIIEACLTFPETTGTVGHGGEGNVNHSIRSCTNRWIPRSDQRFKYLFNEIVLEVLEANHKTFHFDLSNYPRLSFSNAQFTEYHASSEDHYDWHEDNAWVPAKGKWTEEDRKMSCIIQLSEGGEFDGGEFQMERCPEFKGLEVGDLLIIPSFHRHKVTPVTRGIRRSLVLWFFGKRFR